MTKQEQVNIEIERKANEIKSVRKFANNARNVGNWKKLDRCHKFVWRAELILRIMKEHNVTETEAELIAETSK